MGLVIQRVKSNHFSKKLDFINIWWIMTWLWGVGCFDISGVRSKVTVNTSVYWATTFGVDGTYIPKMEFIVS